MFERYYFSGDDKNITDMLEQVEKNATDSELQFHKYKKNNDMYFKLNEKLNSKNSFNPIFVGRIIPDTNNMVIIGKFQYYRYTYYFLIGIYTFLILMALFVSWIGTPNNMALHVSNKVQYIQIPWWSPHIIIAGLIAVCLGIQIFMYIVQKEKRKTIIDVITKSGVIQIKK